MAMKQGTIVDATIIVAPSSTKNEKRERDPEIYQTKKGNQWYFGMKVHIGVDSESGLIPGLIQSLSQALLPGLSAWAEVSGIAPSLCLKALPLQSIST
jgi:hypothetical protein